MFTSVQLDMRTSAQLYIYITVHPYSDCTSENMYTWTSLHLYINIFLHFYNLYIHILYNHSVTTAVIKTLNVGFNNKMLSFCMSKVLCFSRNNNDNNNIYLTLEQNKIYDIGNLKVCKFKTKNCCLYDYWLHTFSARVRALWEWTVPSAGGGRGLRMGPVQGRPPGPKEGKHQGDHGPTQPHAHHVSIRHGHLHPGLDYSIFRRGGPRFEIILRPLLPPGPILGGDPWKFKF